MKLTSLWVKSSFEKFGLLLILLVFTATGVDEVAVDEALYGSVANSVEDIPVMVSRWQKFFDMAEMFAKGTGLIASAAGCVVIGFQIYRDFKTNAPVAQKALDICQV